MDELFPEMTLNTNPRVRKKCLVVYLSKNGYRREEVAKLLRIDKDTVTNYTKKYEESGLPGLFEENYHPPKSQLEPYTEQLKELFKQQVPHTVSQAIEMIDKQTCVRLKPSACRAFLKKIGMKCSRCGVVPGQAMEDDKQRQAQQEFHDQQLQPLLDEAITVTNDTYINQDVFCGLLEKISNAYANSERPITLVLDNARYQKCQSVANKAKVSSSIVIMCSCGRLLLNSSGQVQILQSRL